MESDDGDRVKATSSPKDIVLSAFQLIRLHGDFAETLAQRRQAEFHEQRNPQAVAFWQNVLTALRQIRNETPGTLH